MTEATTHIIRVDPEVKRLIEALRRPGETRNQALRRTIGLTANLTSDDDRGILPLDG